MKTVKLSCQNCGANLDVKDNTQYFLNDFHMLLPSDKK